MPVFLEYIFQFLINKALLASNSVDWQLWAKDLNTINLTASSLLAVVALTMVSKFNQPLPTNIRLN